MNEQFCYESCKFTNTGGILSKSIRNQTQITEAAPHKNTLKYTDIQLKANILVIARHPNAYLPYFLTLLASTYLILTYQHTYKTQEKKKTPNYNKQKKRCVCEGFCVNPSESFEVMRMEKPSIQAWYRPSDGMLKPVNQHIDTLDYLCVLSNAKRPIHFQHDGGAKNHTHPLHTAKLLYSKNHSQNGRNEFLCFCSINHVWP